MVSIPILHFNDVYRVQPFKFIPSSKETIDVTQWLAMLDDVRDSWPSRDDGKRDGLVLFSGDIFAPSTESSVTRGSHMVRMLCQMIHWPGVATDVHYPLRRIGSSRQRDSPGCFSHGSVTISTSVSLYLTFDLGNHDFDFGETSPIHFTLNVVI